MIYENQIIILVSNKIPQKYILIPLPKDYYYFFFFKYINQFSLCPQFLHIVYMTRLAHFVSRKEKKKNPNHKKCCTRQPFPVNNYNPQTLPYLIRIQINKTVKGIRLRLYWLETKW